MNQDQDQRDSRSVGDSLNKKKYSQENVEKREFQSKLKQPTRLYKKLNGYHSDAVLDTETTFLTDMKPTKFRYPLRRED